MRPIRRAVVVLIVAAVLLVPATGSALADTSVPPSAASVAAPSTTLPLRTGTYGPLVATAQDRLAWLGYRIADSNTSRQGFGASTVAAVKAFQSKFGLPATGRIDRRTWRSLSRISSPSGILPRACTEQTSLCIDKTQRVLRYVVKGRVRLTLDARFGAPGMETGEGAFSVKEMSRNHVSSLYHTWMPLAMFFNGDEAVHYSPDFASVGYLRGSHGCVGMRDFERATWLFDRVAVGTRVYVYWSP